VTADFNELSLLDVSRHFFTVAEVRRFIDDYAIANRQKPSGIAAKRTILNLHLVGTMGAKKLDAITTDDVQKLKHRLREHAPKTVNNVLTVLSVLLKKAVEWDVIERVPCTIRLVRAPKPSMGFYDFDDYERLLDIAKKFGPTAHLVVLLGGEAGLRCGEMIGLEWGDVDLVKRQMCIQRSEWRGPRRPSATDWAARTRRNLAAIPTPPDEVGAISCRRSTDRAA